MLGSGIAVWQICCRIVVSLSVGAVRIAAVRIAGVRVMEFGSKFIGVVFSTQGKRCIYTL